MLATGGWLMHYGEALTPFHQLPQDYQKLIVKPATDGYYAAFVT
jgi:hypothetical protein